MNPASIIGGMLGGFFGLAFLLTLISFCVRGHYVLCGYRVKCRSNKTGKWKFTCKPVPRRHFDHDHNKGHGVVVVQSPPTAGAPGPLTVYAPGQVNSGSSEEIPMYPPGITFPVTVGMMQPPGAAVAGVGVGAVGAGYYGMTQQQQQQQQQQVYPRGFVPLAGQGAPQPMMAPQVDPYHPQPTSWPPQVDPYHNQQPSLGMQPPPHTQFNVPARGDGYGAYPPPPSYAQSMAAPAVYAPQAAAHGGYDWAGTGAHQPPQPQPQFVPSQHPDEKVPTMV